MALRPAKYVAMLVLPETPVDIPAVVVSAEDCTLVADLMAHFERSVCFDCN